MIIIPYSVTTAITIAEIARFNHSQINRYLHTVTQVVFSEQASGRQDTYRNLCSGLVFKTSDCQM